VTCWSLEVGGSYPGGLPVEPADLVSDWERRVEDPASEHRWLLADLHGLEAWLAGGAPVVEGLAVDGDRLVVCLDGAGLDFDLRLAHPALDHLRSDGDGPVGPGAFRISGPDAFEVNPDFAGERPLLERIRWLEADDDPRLLFRLDEVDLTVVYGRSADLLLRDPDPPARLERVDRLDRVYFVWIDPSQRWLNDPAFRSWLAGRVDREGLVRFVLGGRGEPALRLVSSDERGEAWPARDARPFAAGSRPRFRLGYDESDRLAARIAERIRTSLELDGIDLLPEPRPAARLRRELSRREAPLVLLAHHPPLEDPLLGLVDTLWRLGPGARDAIARLREASRLTDPKLRDDATRLAEHGLLVEARLVPLVRAHAWLAVDAALHGAAVDRQGRLRLEDAWWER
jgi:MarR-like DNA-binding transcriptional regulator SgrR of sgrS sRNA